MYFIKLAGLIVAIFGFVVFPMAFGGDVDIALADSDNTEAYIQEDDGS